MKGEKKKKVKKNTEDGVERVGCEVGDWGVGWGGVGLWKGEVAGDVWWGGVCVRERQCCARVCMRL